MSSALRYLQRTFRFVAVVSILVALGGFVAAAAAILLYAEAAGVAIPFSVPLTEAQSEQFLVVGGVAFVGGILVNLVARTIAGFVAGFQSQPAGAAGGSAAGGSGAGGSGAGGSGAGGSTAVPTSERYRAKLERTYRFLAVFVGLLVVASLLASVLVPSDGGFSSIPSAILTFAELMLTILFGGVPGGLGTTAVLGALWYGVREGASEALVGGILVGLLFVPVAVVVGSAGWVLFGLMLVYYSLRARGATTFVLVDRAEVPGFVRKLAP
jgi:hypothetical protein